MKFEDWLKTVCFKKPTKEAEDLAKMAWNEAIKQADPIVIDVLQSKITDMQMLIIDLHATLRTCANSSTSMEKTCKEERKRLGI